MHRILDTINSPADVKRLSIPQLEKLAAEIRQELITVLSRTGGHLGPNLGVVELTIALHYVFNTPEDHFLFDVSHQAYVHKLLTGRREAVSHHPHSRRFERLHAAHREPARLLRRGPCRHGALRGARNGGGSRPDGRHGTRGGLAGDAAFTCGITYEALNNIAHHTRRMMVVLNDNEWSIDKNVGAIASYLNKIVTNPKYDYLHDRAAKVCRKSGRQNGAAHGAQSRRSRQEHAVAERHL